MLEKNLNNSLQAKINAKKELKKNAKNIIFLNKNLNSDSFTLKTFQCKVLLEKAGLDCYECKTFSTKDGTLYNDIKSECEKVGFKFIEKV